MPGAVQTLLFWESPFAYLQRCRDRYGPTFTLNATSQGPLVFLSDPDDIRATMASSKEVLRPGEGAAAVKPIVGEQSFMLSDGHDHRAGRKAALAAFHATAIESHVETIVELAQRALARWPTDAEVALHPHLRSLTLELILRTLTGRTDSALDEQTYALHRVILDMMEVTASPVFMVPHLRHGFGGRTWRSFLRDRAEVDQLVYGLIERSGEAPGGLMFTLSALTNPDGSPQSLEQIRDNAMSLILAGHETTAAQLAWAFQLLAHNPAVCERLHEEIDEGRSDAYLTATIQEVLRHRCVFVFAIPRAVAKPVNIGGYTHRPPAHLLACIYLLHHDPAIYPDPHAFRPERFLDAPPDPRAWIPWGGGRKRCPGLHLAMLEMKTVLRTVLAHRTVHPAAERIERPRWRSVIVAPHAGSTVILRPR